MKNVLFVCIALAVTVSACKQDPAPIYQAPPVVLVPTPAPTAAPTPVVEPKLIWCHHSPMICPSPMGPLVDLSGQSCEVVSQVRGCQSMTFECKSSCN